MTVVRAVVVGLVLSAAGSFPWALLAGLNLRFSMSVPWAVLPMTLYLWLYWRYLGGAGWPRETAELRRTGLRANPLSGEVWGASLLAGLLGLAALLPLLGIMARLVRLPVESQPIATPAEMPVATAFLLVVMASIVAVLVSGAAFGLAHYSHHPASVLAMLPYYVAVSAVYGGIAYATNSILPSLVLHAGGDVFSLTRLWVTDRPEWQWSAAPPRLIWESGVDAAFLGSAGAFVLLGAGAIAAYRALAREAFFMRMRAEGRNPG